MSVEKYGERTSGYGYLGVTEVTVQTRKSDYDVYRNIRPGSDGTDFVNWERGGRGRG